MRVPVLMLLVAGCVRSDGADGMVIVANTAATGTSCTFNGEITQPSLSSGIVYAGAPEYELTPLVESRFSAVGSGVEADRSILLQGANVSLSADGVTLPTPSFSTPVAGTIFAGGTLNVNFPLIPGNDLAPFLGSASGLISATVQMFGVEGGGNVVSEPFYYGVTVCTDCVVQDLGDCSVVTAQVAQGNPCNAFQDGTVGCCTIGSDLICPATPISGSGSGSGM